MRTSLKTMLQSLYKNRLPEQRFFSLEDVLLRWAPDRVNLQQICDWVEQSNFVMGVRVRDTSNLSEQFQQEDGSVRTRSSYRVVLAGPESSPPIKTDYLDGDTLVKILTAAPEVSVGAQATYPTVARDKSSGTRHLNGGRYYRKEDLVVCLDEVLRVESLFRIGRKTPLVSGWLRNSAQSRGRFLGLPKSALLLTGAYLLAAAGIAFVCRGKLLGMGLDAVGNFLSGVSAPLTVLWLVAQFRQQAQASAHTEQDILESSRRQEDSLKWLRLQAEASISRLGLERERRRSETEPAFTVQLGTRIDEVGVRVTQHFELRNEGASAHQLQVFVEGVLTADPTKVVLNVAALAQGEHSTFSLTAPKTAAAEQGAIKLVYFKLNGEKEVKRISVRLCSFPNSSSASLPTFELHGP